MSKPVQVMFTDDELAAIDAYRRTQTNPPTRTQAIRDVLRNALGHHNYDPFSDLEKSGSHASPRT